MMNLNSFAPKRSLSFKRFFSLLAMTLLFGQLIFTGGCALLLLGGAAGAGVAGTAYYMGELQGEIAAKPPAVKTATIVAFEKLKLTLISAQSDELASKIKGITSEDESISILAKLQKDGSSKIDIRVGSFGDRAKSEKIFAEIKAALLGQAGQAEQAEPEKAAK